MNAIFDSEVVKFGVSFWQKSLMLTKAAFIWSETIKTVTLWNILSTYYKNILFEYALNVIYSCDGKAL